MRKVISYFRPADIYIWTVSVLAVLLSRLVFGGGWDLSLPASLIGITSLVLNARGNPAGQLLMIIFSILYGIISWRSRYFGEMITYLGMTMPMAAAALVSWLRNPYKGNRSEVAAGRVRGREVMLMWGLTAAVTGAFCFFLRALDTPVLFLSTFSVTTSFLAVYLTFRRDPRFALAYAANDLVLITLWLIAAAADSGCISTVICFCAFFAGDIYGFVCWRRMARRQAQGL